MNFWYLNPYPNICYSLNFYQNIQPFQEFSYRKSEQVVQTVENRTAPNSNISKRNEQKQNQQNSQFELSQERHYRFYNQDRKNVTTNIINKIFSFILCPEKSQKYLKKLLQGNQKKIGVFYAFMKTLKTIKSKYLNTNNLINLTFLPEGSRQLKLIQKRTCRFEILSLQELREVLRKLIFKILRNDFFLTIFSSKKFNTNSIHVTNHLRKCRQLSQILTKCASSIANRKKGILKTMQEEK